jgi:uncharacterized protein
MTAPTYSLTLLAGRYAVCMLPSLASIPSWATLGSDFWSITRTSDELSIICAQEYLPDDDYSDLAVARDWMLLRVEGPFAFDVTGVLAALSDVLARDGVVLLAVATYQTDYLLVKAEQIDTAIAALIKTGHHVRSAVT